MLAMPVSGQTPAGPSASGIFRATVPGVNTQTALGVSDTVFFAPVTGTIATMGAQGYTLTDLDIDTSTGQRYYSAIFQSGVPSTQYWELAPADFANKVAWLALQQIYLISLHTYVGPKNGQLYYSGVFQSGGGPQVQVFSGEMNYVAFGSWVNSNSVNGNFLTSVAVYPKGGQDFFVGVLRGGLKQSTSQYKFFLGDWNSMAERILVAGGSGLRLVSLSSDRQGAYAGAWLAGTDPYEVVAATSADVFKRKAGELGPEGLSPVRILIEDTYRPPIGLAMAFHNTLDGALTGGYSYSISEEDALTATGGGGVARAVWDAAAPKPRSTPMTQNTRLDLSSVTKYITAVAMYKALESSSEIKLQTPSVCPQDVPVPGGLTPDTPIMEVLGSGVLGGKPIGQGVCQVTIRYLLDMDSGLDEGNCGDNSQPGYYDNNAWLACTLSNFTRVGCLTVPSTTFAPPGPSTIPNCYNETDFRVLRAVIEHLTGLTFENYLHTAIFVPLGINNPAFSETDIRNANCHPDLQTPTRPLYYNVTQTSGPGFDTQEYNGHAKISPGQSTARSVAVCGIGGMQMTASQAGVFWRALIDENLITPDDLNNLLGNYVTDLVSVWTGEGFAKNGGYTIHNNQGPTSAAIAMALSTDTEVTVFSNTEGTLPSGVSFDPQSTIVSGLNWIGYHPVDTISVVHPNSTLGPMCFNVEGGGAVAGTPIIQWPCGPKPLPANELFVRVDVTTGNNAFAGVGASQGSFMLVLAETLWTGTPMCIYVPNMSQEQFTPMELNPCEGDSTVLTFSADTSNGFGNIATYSQCLAVDQDSMNSGAKIVQEYCQGVEPSQLFSLQSATAQ
jgi:CubicO group peptidase (beta-lactamase class C family)